MLDRSTFTGTHLEFSPAPGEHWTSSGSTDSKEDQKHDSHDEHDQNQVTVIIKN